jgi:predicted lactoylglutathione lyase
MASELAKAELTKAEFDKRVEQMIKAQVLVQLDGKVSFMAQDEIEDLLQSKEMYDWKGDDDNKYYSDNKDADQEALAKTRVSMEEETREYFERVVMFRAIEDKSFESLLTFYWDRGAFVDTLVKESKKYGGRTVENLAHDLGASAESVYKWRQFATTYTQEQLKGLILRRVPWRTVLVLLGAPSDRERRKLEAGLAKGELEHDDVVKEVKRLNKEEREAAKDDPKSKVDRRGGSSVGSICKGVVKLTGAMDEALSEFLSACGASADLEKEDQEKAKAAFRPVFDEIETLHTALGKALTVKDRYTK